MFVIIFHKLFIFDDYLHKRITFYTIKVDKKLLHNLNESKSIENCRGLLMIVQFNTTILGNSQWPPSTQPDGSRIRNKTQISKQFILSSIPQSQSFLICHLLQVRMFICGSSVMPLPIFSGLRIKFQLHITCQSFLLNLQRKQTAVPQW